MGSVVSVAIVVLSGMPGKLVGRVKVVTAPPGYAIKADYFSNALQAAARAVPGVKWSPERRQWEGREDAIRLTLAKLTHLTIDTRVLPKEGVLPSAPLCIPLADSKLRDYQKTAVNFLLAKGKSGALLADDMGLGKTCSALTAARALDSRTLIVCPSYVRGVWWNPTTGGELNKWWPKAIGLEGEDVFLPQGTKSLILTGEKIIIIHYDILHAWADALLLWAPNVLIFDECHALMNENSRRSKAARAIAAHTPYRWGLSGTPLTNRPKDLWNVADTLCPGVFGGFFSYAMRYCDAKKEAVTPTKTVWKFDGKSNLPELNGRLKSFMLRRVKADVALELPPKTRQSVFVDVPQKTQSFPGELSAKAMRGALDKAADAKLEDAARLVISHLEAGHKVVCFTYRQSVAEGLADAAREAGYETGVVHGGIAPLRRGKAIQSAKDSPGAFLLAATIDSSGTGIDLSFADVCVFAELSYEPHKLLQAEARLHRFGQRNAVLIQYVIARGTTDELVANVVIGKLDSFEVAVGTTGENLQEALAEKTEDIFEDFYKAMAKLSPEKLKPKRPRKG